MAAKSDAAAIGGAIRAARSGLGLTQGQLAELVGLSDRTVRHIEQGSGSPSVGAVIATANALGLSLRVAS